jgi:hypothetical protein
MPVAKSHIDSISKKGIINLNPIIDEVNSIFKKKGFKGAISSTNKDSGSIKDNLFSRTYTAGFDKGINKNFKHAYKVTIELKNCSYTKKNNFYKIVGTINIKFNADLKDSEKDDPYFSWRRLVFRDFLNHYLFKFDYRKEDEFNKDFPEIVHLCDKALDKYVE